uniref:2-C-methyl-D-erythritol 4-phosphate cytidylyltransferase n=1 Tax=candidate division WOR-3 bacterium TaxID=2052148 RepID=A0A7C6AGV1_UNCW3
MSLLTFVIFWLYFYVKVFAIIVGAGKGRRFGGLKQFIEFRGKPLIVHTAECFEKNKLVDRIIVVVPKNMVKMTEKLLKNFNLKKIYKVVSGGKRRQDSVFNGVKVIKERDGFVVIHDAVRPFITQRLIERGIKLCRKYKSVIFGIPIFDTLKLVRENKVVCTVPRISPYAIQTPQFFDIKYLRAAYEKVDLNNEFTDEAGIIENAGMDVFVFKGEPDNIKITTKKDLEFLKRKL